MRAYKTILVGEGGCGKTTWISRMKSEKTAGNVFEKKYIATLGVRVEPVLALSSTTDETFIMNVWDCAGQEKFSGLGDGYYVQGEALVIAFSLDSRHSLNKIPIFLRDVFRVTGNIPYVIVGLKSDVRTMSTQEVRAVIGDAHYVEVSTKKGLNVHEPFKALLRQLNPQMAMSQAKL
jgi:GTP-binding nuclear protein Ran